MLHRAVAVGHRHGEAGASLAHAVDRDREVARARARGNRELDAVVRQGRGVVGHGQAIDGDLIERPREEAFSLEHDGSPDRSGGGGDSRDREAEVGAGEASVLAVVGDEVEGIPVFQDGGLHLGVEVGVHGLGERSRVRDVGARGEAADEGMG
ncbi:hypothetical protein D3C86_1383190 [compost metagenome]